MSSLFGKTPQVNFKPQGFQTAGLTTSQSGGKYNLTQTPGMQAALGGVSSTFGQAAQAFGKLGQTVQPGFSQFRQAGLSDIENARLASGSNLRDQLAQRRILGSSFANSALSQNDATYASAKADFEASSYLQELAASDRLTQEQYDAAVKQFSSVVSQMNFESGVAAQFTSQNNQINAQIATTNAQLQAQSQAGMGKLLGVGAGLALAPFTGGASLMTIPGALAGGGGTGATAGAGSVNFTNPFSTPLTNSNMTWF